MSLRNVRWTFGLMAILFARPARGDSGPESGPVLAAATPEGQPNVSAPPPPPYSAPWGLPSVFAGAGVRLDNSLAFSHDPMNRSVFTTASIFGASYRLRPGVAVAAKLGWVGNQPAIGDAQTTMSNPAVGAAFTLPIGSEIFLGANFSVAIPVGMGGGNMPDPNARAANRAGTYARSTLDQALFTPNYLTLVPMLSGAWLGHDLTVQAAFALSQGIRTRGDLVSTDAYQTALGAGLHVGYTPIGLLSLGAEVRYVATLTTTPAVKADSANREQISTAFGVRGHFKVGASTIHPGLSYTRGIDAPMSRAAYNIIGVDLPVAL